MANEYTLSATGTTTAEFGLAKKVYDANVMRFLEPALLAYSMIPTEDLGGGTSKDIILWYKATAGRHIPHSELTGQNMVKQVITLRYEDEESESVVVLSIRDQLMTHYDASGAMARSTAEAMAQLYEIHTLSEGIEAARTAAGTVSPGGQRVKESRAASAVIATNYPLSIVGSQRLQENIRAGNLLLFEDNVPESAERYCFLKKREHDVLLCDDSLLSRDYVGEAYADKIKGKLSMVDNTWILPTNNFPQSDLSGNTFPLRSGSVVYNGNYSTTAALIMTRDALRKFELEPITPIYDWIEERRHWQIGAVGLKGLEVYRAECACEIYVAAS